MVAPKFEALAASYGDEYLFLKVDIEKSSGLSVASQISSVPTFFLYANGEVRERVSGANIELVRTKVEALKATGDARSL